MNEKVQSVKMMTRSEVAKKLNINASIVSYIISRDEFVNKVTKTSNRMNIPVDLMKDINEFYQTNKNLYHSYISDPDYISTEHMAGFLSITYEELIKQVELGVWDDKYIKIPRLTAPIKGRNNHYNYFFIRDLTIKNYKSLAAIIDNQNMVSKNTLMTCARNGLLPQPEHLKGTNLYDENEIIKELPNIRDEQYLKRSEILKAAKFQAFNLLNEKQQNSIEEYLNYRSKKGTIKFNGFRTKNNIANLEKTLTEMREAISTVFVLIIAGRCNIEVDLFIKRKLNKNAMHLFNPDIFDFLSVTSTDYFYLSNKRKEGTLNNYFKNLRPFYYYYLQNIEIESFENQQQFFEFQTLKMRIEQFLDQFPNVDTNWFNTQEAKMKKSFLKPSEMIGIKDLILSDPVSRNPMKNATIWQLSCTTGLRPEELAKVRIEYFSLDSDGFLQMNSRGWGILRLPAIASKQERSPSHIYGTLIPKDTVIQINNYLKVLYKNQGPLNKKGYGYLFRPHDPSPDNEYKVLVKNFIVRIRPFLTFLTKDQQEKFVLKSARHSMNNLISSTFLPVPELNGRVQKTAAQYQMRHKPNETIGDKYYTALIPEDDFYRVLDMTINFPWDKEKLELWERENRNIKSENLALIEEKNSNKVLYSEELSEKIKHIEDQLINLRTRPKTMSVKEWTTTVFKLNQERNKL